MTTLTISVLLCAASICTGALSLLLTRHLNRLTDQLSGVNVRQPFNAALHATMLGTAHVSDLVLGALTSVAAITVLVATPRLNSART